MEEDLKIDPRSFETFVSSLFEKASKLNEDYRHNILIPSHKYGEVHISIETTKEMFVYKYHGNWHSPV